MKVLLAHGDGQARRALAAALRREGFEVLQATCGAGAIQEWLASKPGLVVLELELPGLDGPTVCRRIRHQALIPVVLLGEDDSEDAIVWALECGADDYVSHPSRRRELVARTRALLRRTRWERQLQPAGRVGAGGLTLDSANCTLSQGGRVVRLSPIEYRIFDLLLANQGRVVPYVTLLAYACGYTEGGMSTLLKSHVYHLRRKTGLSARSEDGLSAVPGAGYRLAEGARLAPPPGELVEGTAQSGRAVSRSSRSLPAAS